MLDFSLARNIAERNATHTFTLVHAVEKNNSGRLQRRWEPVPHVGDLAQMWINVPCNFIVKGQTSMLLEGETVLREYDAQLAYYRTDPINVDQQRVVVDGVQWKIVATQTDPIGINLFLERVNA